MALSKSTLATGSCVFIAALVAILASKQGARPRAENEALRAQVAEYQTSRAEPSVSNEPSAQELNKQDATELLRLRREVTRSKAYAFADGHSEIRREPTEGFEQWERGRMLPGE